MQIEKGKTGKVQGIYSFDNVTRNQTDYREVVSEPDYTFICFIVHKTCIFFFLLTSFVNKRGVEVDI